MLNQQINVLLQKEIAIEVIEKKEPCPSGEFIDEVSEGVEGFLTLVTGCEVSFFLIMTIALGFTIPYLSPAGLILMARSLQNYRQKLRNLKDDSENYSQSQKSG